MTRYVRAAILSEACEQLLSLGERTAVLSGGTDLAGDLRAGRQVDCLVDIKHIAELQEIRWAADGALTIGSCVTMQRVADDRGVAERYPALAKATGEVGSLQVRRRATVAGNLGNASPCADSAPVLLVLGARLKIASPKGVAEAPFQGFICDCKKTVLRPGEIIAGIVIPAGPPGLRTAFFKIRRIRGHDMAVINAAASLDPASREVRLAIGSAAPTPLMISGLEGVCPPGTTPEALAKRLAAKALEQIHPIDDIRASAEYRYDMASLLCGKLAQALLA